jgi:glycosyltransferase involved in cell wall biosynthesis
LYHILSDRAEIEVFAFEPAKIIPLPFINIQYIKVIDFRFEYKSFRFLKKWKLTDFPFEDYKIYLKVKRMKEALQKKIYNHIIVVDFESLWMAQIFNLKHIHFLSLEIGDNSFEKLVNKKEIKSVLIQRQDRYDYVFGKIKHQTFIVQNTPIFKDIKIPENRDKKKFLFAGTAMSKHGIHFALNFIARQTDCTLYIKGKMIPETYRHILAHYNELYFEGRLILDESYTPEEDITDFIKNFRIGFCFYDMRYPESNNFNYTTAPSGKLFKYFAAGVPVIASDLPGLSYVSEYQAGVLISDYSSKSIKTAIDQIEENYDFYVQNCLKAAQDFSFDKHIQPFVDFLLNE